MKLADNKLAKRLTPKKKKTKEAKPDYLDASFSLGTSLVVEQFFSECMHILTDHQACFMPFMFQSRGSKEEIRQCKKEQAPM